MGHEGLQYAERSEIVFDGSKSVRRSSLAEALRRLSCIFNRLLIRVDKGLSLITSLSDGGRNIPLSNLSILPKSN